MRLLKSTLRLFILGVFALLILSGCSGSDIVSGSKKIAVKPGDRDPVSKASVYAMNAPLITTPVPGKTLYLYKVAFDGTMNDRDRIPVDERETLVARIASQIHVNEYYRGAGMQGKEISLSDAMTGTSSMGIARQATEHFFLQADEWHKQHPDAVIRIFVTGFSRGAATAREFMNEVSSEWAKKYPESAQSAPHFYAMLYDTVATGQKDTLNLSIPTSLDYLVHFVATDETRNILFTPTIEDVPDFIRSGEHAMGAMQPQRINIIELPGAHSDIGASYADGIGSLYIMLSEQFLYAMGLTNTNCWDSAFDPLLNGKHDSRGLLDKLFGAPDPSKVKTIIRPHDKSHVAIQTLDEHRGNQERLKQMSEANGKRFMALDVEQLVTSYAGFKIAEGNNGPIINEASENVDHNSVTVENKKGKYYLQFLMTGSKQYTTFELKRNILSQLKKEPLQFSYTILLTAGHSYIALWLDNRLVELLPADQGKIANDYQMKAHCIMQADGSSVSPVQTFIIG